MKNNFRYILFLSAILVVALSACGPDYAFYEEKEFAQEQWTYADSVSFTVTIADTTQLYDLIVSLDHTTTYPRENLYTRISTVFPDGQRLSKVVSLELADKTGIWYGDCDEDWCVYDIPIQTNAFFNQPGDYTFTLEQYTRLDTLPGVRSLAFALLPKDNVDE